MLVDVLSLTLLQLAFGLVAFNLVTPSRDLSGGFFALHGVLALPAAALAGLASGESGLLLRAGAGPSPVALLVVFCASVALHTLLARAGRLGLARLVLAPAVAAGGWLLASRALVAPLAGRGLGSAWTAAGLVLGGLLFGGVVWAMNVGHWYLVSRTLPFQLLVHASNAFGALAVARAALAGVALGMLAPRHATAEIASLVDPFRDAFFFWSRVLWGLAAPVVLAPFVIKTARMKSNQAATGLLYVGLVFVMVGELLATYLTLRSGLPA